MQALDSDTSHTIINMILIPSQKGQLGNHLFTLLHFTSTAIEHGLSVRYPCFNYPLDKFESLGTPSQLLHISESGKQQNKSRRKFFKYLHRYFPTSPFHQSYVNHSEPHIDTGKEEFHSLAEKKILICKGFGFRDKQNVIKHQNELRKIFQANADTRAAVDIYIQQAGISKNTTCIGIHIRRKDYKFYNNGKYFFSDNHWLCWFDQLVNIFQSGPNYIKIILFSDENVEHLTDNQKHIHTGPGDMYEDLEMMNRCDFLLAPPSTFSGWASFMGNVPILRLESPDQNISKTDFYPAVGNA